MKRQFKVKTKLSFSPGRDKQSVFLVQGHVGKKQPVEGVLSPDSKNAEERRPNSQSTHKKKPNSSKLFKNAHHVQPTETYLHGDKYCKSCPTNESSPPHSKEEVGFKSPIRKQSSGKTQGRSISKTKKESMKDIRQTVSIAYKGCTKHIPMKNEVMNSLSKLILGEENPMDDFHLEILGESSIHGDEQNFLDFQNSDFFELAHQPVNIEKHSA